MTTKPIKKVNKKAATKQEKVLTASRKIQDTKNVRNFILNNELRNIQKMCNSQY